MLWEHLENCIHKTQKSISAPVQSHTIDIEVTNEYFLKHIFLDEIANHVISVTFSRKGEESKRSSLKTSVNLKPCRLIILMGSSVV